MGIQSILPEAKPMQERWMGREWKLKPIRTVNWNQLYSIITFLKLQNDHNV